MMPSRSGSMCCVVGCANSPRNSPGTKFYRFPKITYKLEQKNKWIHAIKRINNDGSSWQPNASSRICSRHFIGNKKSDHPLSPSFVPTILPTDVPKHNTSAACVLGRFKRALYRGAVKRNEGHNKNKRGVHQEETAAENSLDMDVSVSLDLKCPRLTFQDQVSECNFIDESSDNCKVFVCNRMRDGSVCEAETQTYIPVSSGKKCLV